MKMFKEIKWGERERTLKAATVCPRLSRALILRACGISNEYQWQSWHANVLAENRGHVKRGHWRRSGSEGCVLPCSRVIAAAARPPRPCSLACTHADRNSTSSVHRHHHRRRCSVRASRLLRMPVWSEEQAKNAPRSLHVVDFTYHLEDTRKNKVSASSSWARSAAGFETR